MPRLSELFSDKGLIVKIQRRLPSYFYLAEIESSRAGKIGMEVGSVRERILIALLIHKFGKANVETEIPITESETDVILFGHAISIKTITKKGSKSWSGVKLIWTVDAQKAREFVATYSPKTDILLVRIVWGSMGGLYLIPLETQQRIFQRLGSKGYFKLPKPGTNPRGVEVSDAALKQLVQDEESKRIHISWYREKIEHDPYQRWVELWDKE